MRADHDDKLGSVFTKPSKVSCPRRSGGGLDQDGGSSGELIAVTVSLDVPARHVLGGVQLNGFPYEIIDAASCCAEIGFTEESDS